MDGVSYGPRNGVTWRMLRIFDKITPDALFSANKIFASDPQNITVQRCLKKKKKLTESLSLGAVFGT